ncbi:MAG: twin-arginine translocase subunit TatC [Planctomycetota bacterium]
MAEDEVDPEESRLSQSEMSFGDHLEELRSRLVRSLFATFLAFFVIFAYRDVVLAFVQRPYIAVARDLHMVSLLANFGPTNGFFASMQISLIAALIIVAPIWIWQIWAFVSVGLYRNERVWVYRFAPLMIALFAAGVTFGYLVLIPIGLRYLLSFSDPSLLHNVIGLSEYLNFFFTLTFMLGIVFQLPVVLALLTRLEILDITTLREKRRHFILGAFIVSAILTPPDAVTQVLMAMPLVGLFELGIFFSWLAMGKNRPPIDVARWRRRGLIVVAVLGLVFLLQDRAVDAYRERMVAWNLRTTDQDEGDAIPYLAVFERCRASRSAFIDFTPTRAFLVERRDLDEDESKGGATARELWVVGDGEKATAIEIVFRDSRITVTSAEGAPVARMLIAPSTQSMDLRAPDDAGVSVLVDPLLAALENAGGEDAALIESLLAGLVGERPGSLGALDPEGGRGDHLTAWRAWRADHADWTWRAGR